MTTETVERKYGEMSITDMQTRAGELRSDFASLSEGERGDTYSESVRRILDEVNILDTHLTLARAQEAREQIMPSAATGQLGGSGIRSVGDQIMTSQGMQNWIDGGMADEEAFRISVDGGIDAGFRAIIGEWGSGGPSNAATNGVNALLPVGQPIPPLPRQARLFMRDLLSVMPTTLSVVPYVRELSPVSLEGGASAVAEGNTKPDAGISLTPVNANVTTLAANISPSRQLWEDAPLVVAYINSRLPYLVKLREDKEILSGSGTWPDITGILNIVGIQSQAFTNSDIAQAIGMGIANIELVDGSATASVMNPTDAWTMFTKRASSGSGTFDAGNPFSGVDFGTVWGLPVMRSRIYASGTALVGDFQRGATLLDRQQVNVQVYPQHASYAAQNAVLVQCEERVGLMVPRPDYFCNVTV